MQKFALCMLILSACAPMSTTTRTGPGLEPLSYPAPPAEALAAVAGAMAGLNWTITQTDGTAGLIIARTPAGLLTYGNTVTVSIKAVDTGSEISASASTAQAIDYGSTRADIRRLFARLR